MYKQTFNFTLLFVVLVSSFTINIESSYENNKNFEIVSSNAWSDNFDDNNYNGWNVTRGSYNVTSGILYGESSQWNWIDHPSIIAYGKWEWRILYGGASAAHICFIGLDKDSSDYYICDTGYSIRLNIEGLFLTRLENGLDETDLDSYSFSPKANSWQTIKVVRFNDNSFNVYLNGTLRMTATDSTYTTSEYIQLPWYNQNGLDWIYASNSLDWSDNFDDNDFDNWTVTRGSFNVSSGILNGIDDQWNWIHHDSLIAYGEWEWKVQYGGIDAAHVCFIGLNQDESDFYICDNGYSIGFNPDGLFLSKLNDGLSETDLDTYSFTPIIDTWYIIKVVRFENNTFNVYLDNNLRLEAYDSTYTTSEFLQLAWYNQHKLDWVSATNEITTNTPTPTINPTSNPDITNIFGVEIITIFLIFGTSLILFIIKAKIAKVK